MPFLGAGKPQHLSKTRGIRRFGTPIFSESADKYEAPLYLRPLPCQAPWPRFPNYFSCLNRGVIRLEPLAVRPITLPRCNTDAAKGGLPSEMRELSFGSSELGVPERVSLWEIRSTPNYAGIRLRRGSRVSGTSDGVRERIPAPTGTTHGVGPSGTDTRPATVVSKGVELWRLAREVVAAVEGFGGPGHYPVLMPLTEPKHENISHRMTGHAPSARGAVYLVLTNLLAGLRTAVPVELPRRAHRVSWS